ncbi:MAG: leucine-rich repeat domain-containing protein, partial [Oscillospiraceae bacterium]|nr:leucine-rich repeat domain-containing protein [Oscillospiraceae bacterium]
MAELRCDVCGGTIQMQAGGYRGVCLNCRVVYSLPRLRELWAELQKPEDLRRRISPDPDRLPEAQPQKVAETAGNGEFEIKKDGTLVHYRGVGPHVVIHDGVTRIGAWSFAGNACITSLVIPEGVKVISKGAFSGLTSLQELKLPEGLETIETWAFSSCENLTSVTMPQSVVEVADRAFENCVRLTGLTTGAGIVLDDGAFEPVQAAPIVLDAGFLNSEFFDIQDGILVKYLGKTPWVEIPRGVRCIGMAAFKDHTALKSVTIP